jgi:hypothetical protein
MFETMTPTAGFAPQYTPVAAIASGIPEAGEVAIANPGASLTDILKLVAETYALTRQQKAFLELNQSLVQQGRTPIGWDQFGASTAVGVQVDSGTQKVVLMVGLAVAGAIALAALRRR